MGRQMNRADFVHQFNRCRLILTIKEKPLKDHLEAKNHQEALDFLYELIDSKDKNTISEHLIKQFHQLIVRDSQRDIAGKYRDGDVIITGTDHRPPSHFELKEEMDGLIQWMKKNYKKMKSENNKPK